MEPESTKSAPPPDSSWKDTRPFVGGYSDLLYPLGITELGEPDHGIGVGQYCVIHPNFDLDVFLSESFKPSTLNEVIEDFNVMAYRIFRFGTKPTGRLTHSFGVAIPIYCRPDDYAKAFQLSVGHDVPHPQYDNVVDISHLAKWGPVDTQS